MGNYTQQTAPTQFVEAAGIRFAYRRFAKRRFGVTIDIPLLFFMHFTGTMDHWDLDVVCCPAICQREGVELLHCSPYNKGLDRQKGNSETNRLRGELI